MNIINEPLPGLLVIKPDVFKDSRGFFLETWQEKRYKDLGIQEGFVQDNLSRSTRGVLRGLHYQKNNPQGKLVSVNRGKVFDVAVDIRKDSTTFGSWYGEVLTDENHLQMYISPGFAHGFQVLSEVADFTYKCTDFYDPADEGGIRWNDPSLYIEWKGDVKNVIISDKDKQLPLFRNLSFHKIQENISFKGSCLKTLQQKI